MNNHIGYVPYYKENPYNAEYERMYLENAIRMLEEVET